MPKRGCLVSDVPSRREVTSLLEAWWEAIQTEEVHPAHPLASVQSLRLVAARDVGPYRLHGKETRATGRSMPLVRDLPGGFRLMDQLMRDIRMINQSYHTALMLFGEHRGVVSEVARRMNISRPVAFRYIDAGLGMLQIGLLRG